jgi:hypothetical protein
MKEKGWKGLMIPLRGNIPRDIPGPSMVDIAEQVDLDEQDLDERHLAEEPVDDDDLED